MRSYLLYFVVILCFSTNIYSAAIKTKLLNKPLPSLDVGQWAEWSYKLKQPLSLKKIFPDTKSSEKVSSFILRLSIISKKNSIYLARSDLKFGKRIVTQEKLQLDLPGIQSWLVALSEKAEQTPAGEEVLQISTKQLKCKLTKIVIESGLSQKKTGESLIVWSCEQVPLGLVKIKSKQLEVILQNFGTGPSPAFPSQPGAVTAN